MAMSAERTSLANHSFSFTGCPGAPGRWW